MVDRLGAIEVPTLVVVGNQDILTPRGDSEELAELIPTAELVVISGAAHGLMIEHASTYNRVLLDFLRPRAEAAWQARQADGAARRSHGRRGRDRRRLTLPVRQPRLPNEWCLLASATWTNAGIAS